MRRPHRSICRSNSGALALELFVALAVATAPLTARTAQPPDPSAGHTHTVLIEGVQYNPRVLIVHAGDRITWINKDPVPHTVTETDGRFDSHPIAPGGSWTYVARRRGEYDYACKLHPNMKGRVEVR